MNFVLFHCSVGFVDAHDQGEAERRRLEMCEDCRVKDLMRAQQGGGPGSI